MWTIGVSTERPDGLDPANELNDLDGPRLSRRGRRPDEGVEPEPDEPDGLWPGVAPPVAYQGATGEKLHSKWVTFHEGPALLL